MALKTLLLKRFPESRDTVLSVSTTTSLKLVSLHYEKKELMIFPIHDFSCNTELKNVETYAWQDDNYSAKSYRLLIVNDQVEICLYSITVKKSILTNEKLTKWNAQTVFQSFQELLKSLGTVRRVEILKFESKEAVFLFDGKVVVSIFPSVQECVQVMSIVDLREDSPVCRKVLLLKDTLLALNQDGTKLFVYSFLTTSKVSEIECNSRVTDGKPVTNFVVNSQLSLVVLVTSDGHAHPLPLVPCDRSVSSPVTAFTKHLPSLLGGPRRASVPSLVVPGQLLLAGDKLCSLHSSVDGTVLSVHALNSELATTTSRLPHSAVFMKSGSEEIPFPILVFSHGCIYLLLYDIEQDKLVNELMVYPSSDAVETISALNNWSNIHMDIKVLTLGLSNRQLYTVQFFLKALSEGFCQLWKGAPSERWEQQVKKECVLWENVLNVVLDSVKKSMDETHSCQYAEQLLQVSMNMVIQMMSVIHSRGPEKNAFLSTFSRALLGMRELLRERSSSSSDDQEESAHSTERYSKEVLLCWRKWDKLSDEYVIEDSILNGCIPMAQAFFSCYKKDSTKGSYSDFESVAENLLLQNLRQGCMNKALDVLLNTGIDVNSKLMEVFKSTSEKGIRELVNEELSRRKLLSQDDLQSLQFLTLLEKLYPCSSFEHAKILLHERHTREETVCAVKESKDFVLPVGDFMDFQQDNSESGAYCRLLLEWLSSWDGDVKGRVMAPHYLKNSSVLQLCGSKEWEIDPVSVWSYLLEHGNLPYLLNWADIWLGLHPRDSDGFSALDQLPISQAMVNMIPEKAPLHVSESLLNGLAKYGIFCEKEMESMPCFLNRLGRAQYDLSDPGAFANEKACLSHANLCHLLVHYCLEHNLVQFLYTLLSNYGSKLPEAPMCQDCDVLALSLTKTFYMWSQNHNDSQLAYAAATSAAKHVFGLSSTSPANLIRDLPLPLALGILLLAPPDQLSTLLPSSAVREHCPLLFNFLFRTPEERAQPDITVYGLLKGNTVFDSTQLFGWQSANALRSEESQNELPHFSLQSLCEQYGLKKDLTYLYYLMEGRPNYAYLKFIAQEVVLETGLSKSRVQTACREVTEYALSNYTSLAMSSACIYFMELLGQDSLPLRVSLAAANMLREGKEEQELELKLKKAYVNKDAATELINDLEQVVMKAWHPFKADENAIIQDIIFWMPVMALSHLHEIEAGNSYLMECARQNQWLKFIIFAQIFQVPKEQVLKAASTFSDPCISYHIFHSLHRNSSPVYDAAYESKTVPTFKTQKRDMRSSLYARIGLRDLPPSEKKPPVQEPNIPDDIVSIASEDTSTSSDTDLRFVVLKDLFSQLLLAQNSDYPWDCLLHTCYEIQNPVLALLAASYSDARLENCFYMWLYSSLCCSEMIKKEVEENFDEIRVTNCSTDDIEDLMLLAVKHHKILTLWKGVHIFLPNTPLASLMSYLRSFLIYKNFKSSVENFQNQLWDYPKASSDSSVLMSLTWIENVSISILKTIIIACSSSHERLIMLKHLSVTRMEKSFSKNVYVPPFTRVYNMLHCLGNDVEVEVHRLFGDPDDPTYISTCWGAMEKLMKLQKVHEAQTFADAAGLSQEHVLLLQIKEETLVAQSGSFWNCVSFRADFWKGIFQKLRVLPLGNAIDFIESQVESSPLFGDKYFLLKLLIELVEDKDHDIIDVEAITKRMWCYCIKAEINKEISPQIFDVAPVHNFDVEDVLLECHCAGSIEKIEYDKEREALGSIIGAFLSKKDVKKAFELATQFKFQCNDLLIIKTCLELAREDRTPDSVDLSLPKVALDVPSSRIIRSLVLWVTTESNALSTVQKSIIKCMDSLNKFCAIAVPICHHILVHSVISMVLGETYGSVSKEKDVFSILRRILVLKLKDEFVLAKSLITVHELADREVAKFLSEEIWQSLKKLSISSLIMIPEGKNAFGEDCIYDPLNTSEGFQLIVKLCQDPSLLGYALINIFNSEAADLQPSNSEQSFYLLADICICAHECFTIACNMEGISQVLHCSQLLVSILEEAKRFNIMVYLMVRLQRYNEMMYIFEILKANDKISILFAKDMEEYSDLRHSLLDFLKRFPTAESEPYYYELASRFGMHREKAEILEMAVHKALAQLCKKNTDANLKEELEKALQLLSDAAKSYCEADCLHQAQNCTRLAQLIALQIYFVPAGIWIIGLNDASVTRFITDHDKFSQAYIVAEEYDKHHLWSQSILHNVVLRGDREYLHDFKSYMGLSTSLIVDVAKRFSKVPAKSESVLQNMRMLLSLCPNVKTKYSLASELGFADMTSEMMMGDASAYLMDLMANGTLN